MSLTGKGEREGTVFGEMHRGSMKLERLPYELTVCKVESIADIDLSSGFFFIGNTGDEISLVCLTKNVPSRTTAREDGWRGFRVQGPLDFSLVGILSEISGALAERGIAIFAVSTYDTDYILVKAAQFEEAARALGA